MNEARLEQLEQDIKQIKDGLNLILSVLVVQQKDACQAFKLDPGTIRRKVLNGEAETLTPDGSRLNYVQLKQILNLKKRTKPKRKR